MPTEIETITPSAARGAVADLPVTKSEAAASNSAGSRINIPLNLENWRGLAEEHAADLLWFHQHALDDKLTWEQCAEALDYEQSVVFRVLKGTYEGSWKNVCDAIRSYRKIVSNRGTIQKQEFVENRFTRLIFAGLDYAMANNSITLIVGESRMGKTTTGKEWKTRNNHGRSVFVTAPAYGGTKALMRDIASAIGVNKNLSAPQMHEAILRGFNRNRILIVDEAHRLLPGDRRTNPVNLEILRDIHDRTGCALALLSTQRFQASLTASEYQFEQLLGRIGMPVRLPRTALAEDIRPIVVQYVRKPTAALMDAALKIVNEAGRFGILVETLKVASRIAAKGKATLDESHVFKAIAIRKEMMGETTFAAK